MDLTFDGLVDADRFAAPVAGPRRWWSGPLAVEELVLGSVRCALTAANAAVGERRFEVRSDLVAANVASIGHLRVDGRGPEAFAPMSGFFRCVDGWIRTHANFPHHAAALHAVFGADDAAGLSRALAEVRAVEAETLVRRAGGIAGVVRTREEWVASAPGAAVEAQPWIRLDAGDGDPRGPEGMRVLDLTRVIAGPTASKLLAALGADVLRVDSPHRPELLDQHLDTGAGKRSATADLADRATLRRLHELVDEADVVLLGYRPGALDRFGLAPADLAADHPRLAVVHLDAWGDTGPWAGERGFDSVAQAPTGIADAYRKDDGAPGALPVQALDHATGHGVAAAALSLVGRGGIAHLSLARTAGELFRLGTPTGSPATSSAPLAEIDSPHGRLTQVHPLVGKPLPPGEYGAAGLAWRR